MTFREIIGHRRVKRLLAQAVKSETLPPSLLFAGPDGIGKRQVALALAQSLNCLNPVSDETDHGRDGCGACAACSRIARGLHPDVMLIKRPADKTAIIIEQTRELVREVGYRPFEGRVRTVIFDEAEDLGVDSQDALLKTLEEPPPRNVFVLVTSRPNMLATTVRSRCCTLRFAPPPPAEIAAALVQRHGFGESDARAAAAHSGGSVARALAAGAGERPEACGVAIDVLTQSAQASDPRARLSAAAALLKTAGRKSRDAEREGKVAGADRALIAERLRAMGSLLRDLAVLTTRAPDSALVNLDLRADLETLARHYDRDRLTRAFSAVGRSLAALERNASPKIVADWLVLQL